MMEFPATTKALVIEAYNANLVRALRGMKMIEKPFPEPQPGEVLVKMDASPVNPSDIAFLRGMYNVNKPLPAVPGFEGTGIIVETGDENSKNLIGKRVSFFTQDDSDGAWCEYLCLKAGNYLFVNNELPVEQAACLFINPFTAYAMFDEALKSGTRAIIQTAANGQVGRFIRFFAKENGINVINLVRKNEHVEALKSEGELYVLNLNDENFYENLKNLNNNLNATVAIDAVGGEITGKLMNVMPAGSQVILYGGLSGALISMIDPLEVIFKSKILKGFNLGDWMKSVSDEELERISGYLQALFIQKKLETRIQASFPLENFYDGLRAYISNMSAGKVLFRI
jgi:NADPH:quinone reductase-like Zn-dependent oxidoreductase